MLFLATLGSLKATVIWNETFPYGNGSTITVASGIWARHSGSASPSDSYITNHILIVANTGTGTINRQDDINRPFGAPYTTTATILYASFTVIVTNAPVQTNYFAHFINGTTTFNGRVFCQPGSFPGTFRLGISGAAGTPSKVFPADLATNTPYQVVVGHDAVTSFASSLWVNPIGSTDTSVTSSDTIASQLPLQGYAFRQGSTFSNFYCGITNLVAATTFDEAATNVWSTNPVAPTFLIQPKTLTNFIGVSNAIFAVANGQGQGSMTYTWRTNGVAISNPLGNTNFLSLTSFAASDSADYTLVATTPFGLSATSAVAHIWITNAPVPATITQQPASNSLVYPEQSLTLTVTATGPGPIDYTWFYNGSPISGAPDSPSYTIPAVDATNGTVGTYKVDVVNPFGTTHSSNAVVGLKFPIVTNIYAIRGLVDPTFLLPTDTTTYYTVSNATVISKTNFTTSANDEFFISDGTASISVFYGGAASFRPNPGDTVTVTGPLSQFNSLLEFNLSASDASTYAILVTSNNPAPVAKVLPLSFTNSVAYGGTSNALRRYGASLVMLTNITILEASNGNTFASSGTYTMLDPNGGSMKLFVYSGFSAVIGQVIPTNCFTITGIMSEFIGATVADRSSGYEFEAQDIADFVTTAPPAVTIDSPLAAGKLTWTAVPYSYPYSVLASTNAAGPYLPIATGLVFPSSAGSFTDASATNASKFYEITSP